MIDPKDTKAGAFSYTLHDAYRAASTAATDAYRTALAAEINAEIVEAVDKWMAEYRTANIHPYDFYPLLFQSLIDRRRALLKPKDAVGELLEAVRGAEKTDPTQTFWQHRGLIAAIIEAAARVRKERGE